MTKRRTLHPPIEPYRTGMLDVGDGHSLYWELSGQPNGKPVVFLHGGPGSCSSPDHRRLFDPSRYNILVFDQRGCGQSAPHASVESNTTWHLVRDLEQLRADVAGVDRWMLFGGSWGATLALAYAQSYPERVTEVVLRGVFLFDQREVDWLFREGGASEIYPEEWDRFVALIPEQERDDLIEAYYRRLTSDDQEEQLAAARRWSRWEGIIVTLLPNHEVLADVNEPRKAIAKARIENHYMRAGGWLSEGQLLRGANKLHDISGVIVQGRHDACTPPGVAWKLHRAWPAAEFIVVPDAGHLYSEPGILDALIRATDGISCGYAG